MGMLAASSCESALVTSIYGVQDKKVRHKFLLGVAGLTFIIGLLLGILPVAAPRQFAILFGGKVYAFTPEYVVQNYDMVRRFTYLNFGSYLLALTAMASRWCGCLC